MTRLTLTARQRARGFIMESKATIPCIVWPDGLLVAFAIEDVEAILDANHPRGKSPFTGETIWYFNSSRDREMAEQDGDVVVANPYVLEMYFMPYSPWPNGARPQQEESSNG